MAETSPKFTGRWYRDEAIVFRGETPWGQIHCHANAAFTLTWSGLPKLMSLRNFVISIFDSPSDRVSALLGYSSWFFRLPPHAPETPPQPLLPTSLELAAMETFGRDYGDLVFVRYDVYSRGQDHEVDESRLGAWAALPDRAIMEAATTPEVELSFEYEVGLYIPRSDFAKKPHDIRRFLEDTCWPQSTRPAMTDVISVVSELLASR